MLDWIDHTQFTAFQRCPWYWYERYVQRLAERRTGQRDDPITIGQLVHAGIQSYISRRLPEVPTTVVEETGASGDAVTLAREMLAAYVTAFPPESEPWRVEAVETPLRDGPIVAKVDAMVSFDRPLTINDGVGGTLTLSAGTWVLEHKTTSSRVDRAMFMARWTMDKQADFQILATGRKAQGVILNVIERPAQRKQVRTCRACGALNLVAAVDWGDPRCGFCGARQRWTPPAPSDPITVWRFAVTRTPEQLDHAQDCILRTLRKMQDMVASGRTTEVPNFRSCVDQWSQPCPYLNLHLYGADHNLAQEDTLRYIGD